MHITAIKLEIRRVERVAPEDIIDGIKTLRPKGKLSIEISHPGQGPDHFLKWAYDELIEAEKAIDASEATRKAFNVSVLSKCAVECLVDWYLSKHLLNLTINPQAGLVQKLESLNAEDRLGIGFSLFNNTIFEPRNKAIHKYELVDVSDARRSYELANLTIKNCRNTELPQHAPIFYGTLELYRGDEAFRVMVGLLPQKDTTAFYFAGLGPKGECSVFLDRKERESRIAILTSLGDGDAEVRYCPVANSFSGEQLRAIFHTLEESNPMEIELAQNELDEVIQAIRGAASMSRGDNRIW